MGPYKRVVFVAIATLLTCTTFFAQTINTENLANLKFRNIGPAGMSGRVTAIDVELRHQGHILVGSASGGVWESTDGGTTWVPIFDEEPALSIGAVKFNQRNPLEIWVGTGEGDPRNSQNSGRGIFKSMDGGKTWKLMGLENTRVIHRIIIDPFDPSIVYAGAMGSAWGPTSDRGLYKTTDGGQTWKKILFVNDSTGVCDMVMDPENHQKLIVATWEYGRTPWSFTSGGKGSGIHVTFDGGVTWKDITNKEGMPKGILGRIGLAMAYNKPNIVYALVEANVNGLYKSVDGGLNWSEISTKNIGDRPFYYSQIFVDPSNENRIWNLYSYVSKSEDGGKTFQTVLNYSKGVHPDHHAFWISPTDPNFMMDGNDGGLNISRDGGQNWRFVMNLPVGQFYHVNVDNEYPYHIYGGMQDNGSWIGPAYVLKAGGIRNPDWREVLFGDGFDIMPNRANPRFGWAMWQGGSLNYYDYQTGATEYQKPVSPEGTTLRFNWNAALAQNPFHDCGIYYGSQFLHKSLDCGKSWETISPDLTTNDSLKQRQDISGGLTIDATGAENYTTILAIAPSPVDENVIWVGTDDGNVQLTRDGGKTWTLLNPMMPGLPRGAWIPQIEVSRHQAGEAFVVVNNYRQNDWSPYLYHTTDYGKTFTRLVRDGDIGSFVCSVVQDLVEPKLLFLGADDGLYFSIDGGTHWQKWYQKGLPSVQVADMKIHPVEQDLVLATFGRAIWILDDIRPLRAIASSGGEILEKPFAAFASPDAVMAEFRSVDGTRFTADAEFLGDNRQGGARFTVWKKPEEKKTGDQQDTTETVKSKKEKRRPSPQAMNTEAATDTTAADKKQGKSTEGKLKIAVLDTQGDTIRRFSRKLEDGFNRLTWDMSRDGVRGPSRREKKEDADPPSGRYAPPGSYKLVFEYQGAKDSTRINMQKDPRSSMTDVMWNARDKAIADFEAVVKAASDAFDQLKQAQKTVSLIDKVMVNEPDSVQESIKKQNKTITQKIDSLTDIFMLPEDVKGIRDTDSKLQSMINEAYGYLQQSIEAPGENAMDATERAKSKLQDALGKVNAFIENDWNNYVSAMEQIDFDLFGKVEKVEMKD